FQYFIIALLIFCMGVSLGSRPTLMQDLKIAGLQSLAFSLLPIAGSTILVYIFLGKKQNKAAKQGTSEEIAE
ncbi:MAG TPA: hypothetical protein DCP97_04795, partial [Ruminococcaceae bacterium]|nr:hypothetical protein [Oscillospiraceae bacterium]